MQEPLKNYIVTIFLTNIGAKQAVRIMARSKFEAIDKVYEYKGFKHKEPDRSKYKAIEPFIKTWS